MTLVKQPNISQELKEFMKLNDINNLDDLFVISPENLLKMNGFGYRLLREVLSLKKPRIQN